jgi:hypothetical protein
VCKYDPEKKWIGPSRGEGAGVLGELQSDYKQAPMALEKAEGSEAVCQTKDRVLRLAITKHPLALAGLLTHRVWKHMGPWELPELWEHIGPSQELAETVKPASGRTWWLAETLNVFNSIQYIYLLVLAAAIGLFFLSWPSSPLAAFLLFAGLGHAFGIAMANPWLALRYMAISKLLVTLAFVKLAYDYFARRRNRSHTLSSNSF